MCIESNGSYLPLAPLAERELSPQVGVASIIAMIVGNMFNHGLYHGLIPVMNMPYLNSEPADVMNLVRVSDVMARDVLCVSKMAKPSDIEQLIRQCDIGE